MGAISLKVYAGRKSDLGKRIARIDKRSREDLGVEAGDTIAIKSRRRVVYAEVRKIKREYTKQNLIRIPRNLMEELGVSEGDYVDVEKSSRIVSGVAGVHHGLKEICIGFPRVGSYLLDHAILVVILLPIWWYFILGPYGIGASSRLLYTFVIPMIFTPTWFLIFIILVGSENPGPLMNFLINMIFNATEVPTNIQVNMDTITMGVLLTMVIRFAYYLIMEGTIEQSIGKKALRLKVVTDLGGKIGFAEAFVRRVSTIIPVLDIIDAFSIVISRKKQRIFDIVAKTVVVDERTIGEAREVLRRTV